MGAVGVDHAKHIIYSVYEGTFAASEFREHVSQINELGLGADYAEIIDLSGVTEFEISTSEWRQLARIPLAARLRVMVAHQDMVYGMGRMFQVFAESESRVAVVRSIEEAEQLIQQSK